MQGVSKTSTFNVLNNSSQILTNFNDFFACEILRKFDTKILQIVHLACHYTFGNPKKSFFNSIIHIYFWLLTLSHKKTICNPFAHPTWKCHHTNLWTAKLFPSDWRFLRSFRRWRLWKEPFVWVVVSGTEKNPLWCVRLECQASNVAARSALIHASSLFRHW